MVLVRCQFLDLGIIRSGNGSSAEAVTSYFLLSPERLRWPSIPDLGISPEE